MTLLDTNVLIYASAVGAEHHEWACGAVTDAVSADGAAVSAVRVAEICVGVDHSVTEIERSRDWGVAILDVPGAAAEGYVQPRTADIASNGEANPGSSRRRPRSRDFFIGAHAEIMQWSLATADRSRIATYFPAVPLITPFRR